MYCPSCDQSFSPVHSRCPECKGWLKTKKGGDSPSGVMAISTAEASGRASTKTVEISTTAIAAAKKSDSAFAGPAATGSELGAWGSGGASTLGSQPVGNGWGDPKPAASAAPLGAGWNTPSPSAGLGTAPGAGWNSPSAPPASSGLGGGWSSPSSSEGLGGSSAAPASGGLGGGGLGGWSAPAPASAPPAAAPELGSGWGGGGLGGPPSGGLGSSGGFGSGLGSSGPTGNSASMSNAGSWSGGLSSTDSNSADTGWVSPAASVAEPEQELELPDFTQPVDMGTQWDEGDAGSKNAKLATVLISGLLVGIMGFFGYLYVKNREIQTSLKATPSPASHVADTAVGDFTFKDAKRKYSKQDYTGAARDMRLAAEFFRTIPGQRQKESKSLMEKYCLKEADVILAQARASLARNDRNVAIGLADRAATIYKEFKHTGQYQEAKAVRSRAQSVGSRLSTEPDEPQAPEPQAPVENPSLDEDPSAPRGHAVGRRPVGSSAPPATIAPEPVRRPTQAPAPVYRPTSSQPSVPLGQRNKPAGY
jgi:hypothetical protein